MKRDLIAASAGLLAEQRNIISRRQCADDDGTVPDAVRDYLRSGRWQAVQRGVYATFTGELSREAELWAALLRIDPGRADGIFSHQTAAQCR